MIRALLWAGIIASQAGIAIRLWRWEPSQLPYRSVLERSYDYVIVGAGSAGCVLANRLSEDGSSTVLLIEAGEADSDIGIHVPLAYPKKPSCKKGLQKTPHR